MIGWDSLIHVNWSDWISLEFIPLDTLVFSPRWVMHNNIKGINSKLIQSLQLTWMRGGGPT